MRLSLFLLFSFILAFPSPAQDKIDLLEQGLSVSIPVGWTGQQQGEYMIYGHTSVAGLLIVSMHGYSTMVELRADATQGIYENGVMLSPEGNFTEVNDKRLEGFYTGYFDGAQVKCKAIGLINPYGMGVSILTLTTTEVFGTDQINAAKKVADGVSFFKPKESSATAQWKDKLIGKKLQYMYTSSSTDYSGGYSGSSDKVIINLYENNSFWYYSNSHASFDIDAGSGYVNDNGEQVGRYSIGSIGNITYLYLHLHNGEEWKYELSKNSEGHTLLNGKRYFVVGIGE